MKPIVNHYESKLPLLFQATAITFGRHIFYSQPKNKILPRLIRHEEHHVEQYRRYGVVRFLFIYLQDYFKLRLNGYDHWDAYNRIPFEIEAKFKEL